ncbi:MAG: glycosyltransferase [Anaerolineae bacterium]|nr:glycosyltransferase [Anaerolineae bacterium]
MKILVVVSSLDLTQPFSATPAWWQLLKALYEVGVEVIATPYQGPAIESLWWRAAPNPAKWQGDVFKSARDLARNLKLSGGSRPAPTATPAPDDEPAESSSDRFVRQAAQSLIAPLWLSHLDKLLTKEPDIDAVIFLTIPLNQLVGVPAELIRKHGKPIFYYDGDVPASLPNLPDMRGFHSGFRIYQGADPAEYTAFISNSAGGMQYLKALGAREVHTLFYGVDTDVFSPARVEAQDIDAFFYGHGREYREQWIDAMIAQPSQALPESRFAVRGKNLGQLGRAETLPYLSFNKMREYACRSKLNLCITRMAHASVHASSSSRPFELASMGCCIVGNPYAGVDTWFEPGKEIVIVRSAEEAMDRYRFLLGNEMERKRIAAAAFARVHKQHTMRHRARELVEIINGYL